MHTAHHDDWSVVESITPETQAYQLDQLRPHLDKDDLPSDRPKSLEYGYWAFWRGEPFDVPEAAITRGCAELWSAGYTQAYRAACRHRALPLLARYLKAGMHWDRGRALVDCYSIDNQSDKIGIRLRNIEAGARAGSITRMEFKPTAVVWVNSAPKGTLTLMSRPLEPGDLNHIDGWVGVGHVSAPLFVDHLLNQPFKDRPVHRDDIQHRNEADSAATRDTKDPAIVQLVGDLRFSEAIDIRVRALGIDVVARQFGESKERIEGWQTGSLPTKSLPANLARSLGVTVAVANRMYLREWVVQAHAKQKPSPTVSLSPDQNPNTCPDLWAALFRALLTAGWRVQDLADRSKVPVITIRDTLARQCVPRAQRNIDQLSAALGCTLPSPYKAPARPPEVKEPAAVVPFKVEKTAEQKDEDIRTRGKPRMPALASAIERLARMARAGGGLTLLIGERRLSVSMATGPNTSATYESHKSDVNEAAQDVLNDLRRNAEKEEEDARIRLDNIQKRRRFME